MFFVEFSPGQGLPWHVHPGGHELVYSLEGTFAFEQQNGTKSSLRPGEVMHIGPDIGHTVPNEGSDGEGIGHSGEGKDQAGCSSVPAVGLRMVTYATADIAGLNATTTWPRSTVCARRARARHRGGK